MIIIAIICTILGMRRAERMVSQGEARRLLDSSSYGVLSLVSPDGQPYGVPVNHVYVPQDNAVYIHCRLQEDACIPEPETWVGNL